MNDGWIPKFGEDYRGLYVLEDEPDNCHPLNSNAYNVDVRISGMIIEQ